MNDASTGHRFVGVRRFDATGAVDGAGVAIAGGVSVVVERTAAGELTLLALGPTGEIARSTRWGDWDEGAGRGGTASRVVNLAGALIMPALVNAHTHLDLTAVGPRAFDAEAGFGGWIDMVRRERATDPAEIEASVRQGVERLLAGGVAVVGDIAGAVGGRPSRFATRALIDSARETGLGGVSFVEFFAQGANWRRGVDSAIEVADVSQGQVSGVGVRVGLHPHAPYSVHLDAYQRAVDVARERGWPICTHASESPAEREFIASASGPLRMLLESVGVWDEHTAAAIGRGLDPVSHLKSVLDGRLSLVHVNQLMDEGLNAIARTRTPVIYCARASAYFEMEKHFGPHRYRELLAAGIDVALGTDSVIGVTPGQLAHGLTPWHDAALLFERDRTSPISLLRMMTVAGLRVLVGEAAATSRATLKPGPIIGLCAIDVAGDALGGSTGAGELLASALGEAARTGRAPRLIAIGRAYDDASS